MFSEFAQTKVDLTMYNYLSFDKASAGLEGEDLEILEGMIKDYCDEQGLAYLDMDMTRLRRSLRIESSSRGDVFSGGYLLTFSQCHLEEGDEGEQFFTGDIEFWHGDFDAVGGLDFIIIKTDKGWYIDRNAENGGYNTLLS